MDNNSGLFLITTSNENTWEFDKPVIFLGEWCKLYSRKELWLSMNSITAEPYKPNYTEIDTELEQVNKYTTELLAELTQALNLFHETNHSQGYWNLLLGHWLYRYICVLYNRYYTMNQVFERYDITSTVFLDLDDYKLIPQDSYHFVKLAANDEEWNHLLYVKIIDFCNFSNLELKNLKAKNKKHDDTFKISFIQKLRRSLLDWVKIRLLPIFSRNSDAVITQTYLPLNKEFHLNLLLKQFPQFWVSPKLICQNPDSKLRKRFTLNFNQYRGFDKFIRKYISEIIPVCYLEGYSSMVKQVNKLNWPNNPKFIFTSNRFDFDEIFKTWSANKISQGCKYFVGQHGNNYGTLKGIQNTPEQVEVSKFLTWGWTNESNIYIPTFNFKLVGKKERKGIVGNGLLLIASPPPLPLRVIDESYDYIVKLNGQFQFVSTLRNDIINEVGIRLYPNKNINYDEEKKWEKHFPKIKFDTSSRDIFKLTSKYKLVIHTYDSTGILETLALNIPTICFWNDALDHLIPSARPYYKLLMDVGILFNSPLEAANTISANWDTLDKWWESKMVQDARIYFCNHYSRIEKSPLKKLKKLLTKNLQEIESDSYNKLT